MPVLEAQASKHLGDEPIWQRVKRRSRHAQLQEWPQFQRIPSLEKSSAHEDSSGPEQVQGVCTADGNTGVTQQQLLAGKAALPLMLCTSACFDLNPYVTSLSLTEILIQRMLRLLKSATSPAGSQRLQRCTRGWKRCFLPAKHSNLLARAPIFGGASEARQCKIAPEQRESKGRCFKGEPHRRADVTLWWRTVAHAPPRLALHYYILLSDGTIIIINTAISVSIMKQSFFFARQRRNGNSIIWASRLGQGTYLFADAGRLGRVRSVAGGHSMCNQHSFIQRPSTSQ